MFVFAQNLTPHTYFEIIASNFAWEIVSGIELNS